MGNQGKLYLLSPNKLNIYIQLIVTSMQKYEILSVIGEGAYGVVLKCKDAQTNTFMAIKKFKDSDEEQLAKKTAMREVKILKMLTHQNIVEMKEAFRKKGIVYLVFQFIQNNLLEVLQKSPSGLQPQLIRKLIYQLIKGLAYLHNLQIVHRDIKPQNLLVSTNNDLKICDFGFARLTKKQKGEVEMTDYVATRWYRPPELLVGGQYGKQIDMWAVGCIMCQLIDGNPLFPGQNQLDQLFLIQKTFGPLPPKLHERFIKNQRYLGMKFPQIQNLDLIEKKYFGKMDPKGLSLIKSLLKMLPQERITAEQALNHPYFSPQKHKQPSTSESSNYRKQIYSSTAHRKREEEDNSNLERMTKYGKIYNRRKTTNYNQIAMIYQSSNQHHNNFYNQFKIGGQQSKSLGKGHQTNGRKSNFIHMNQSNYKHNQSFEKAEGKQALFKTEFKGFYAGKSESTANDVESMSRKTQQMAWQSNNQLPFLVTNSSNTKIQQVEPSTGAVNKKKPHIYIQKKQGSNGASITQNFKK